MLRTIVSTALAALIAFSSSACGSSAPSTTTPVTLAPISGVAVTGTMPAAVNFDDQMGAAVVSRDTVAIRPSAGAPRLSTYQPGDVGYDPRTQHLFVFFTHGVAPTETEIISVGHLVNGLEALTNCTQSCQTSWTVTENEFAVTKSSPRPSRRPV